MATASNLAAGGSRNAFDTISASTSGSLLVDNATSDRKIRVTSLGISCSGTPSTVQFKSNTTACSPVFQNSISLPHVKFGWFETAAGADLNVDTGSGGNTAVLITYEYAKA